MTILFNSNKDAVLSTTAEAITKALEICGGMIEGYAKQLCPVDTGNLRNSITHEQENEETEVIGSAVEYAPYVELGTSRMKAQPYLQPAIENHINEIQSTIETTLKGN